MSTSGAVQGKVDEIALHLEQAIVSGALAPGTVLRQERLCEEFAVSRTPVREALQHLSALGLVTLTPHRGARVAPVSTSDFRDAYRIRAELEGLAAGLAAPILTDVMLEDVARREEEFRELTHLIRSDVSEQSELNELATRWVRANDAFHDLILQAAQAPLLLKMAHEVRRASFVGWVWQRSDEVDFLYTENLRQHRAIREALWARSAEGARVLVREHVLYFGQRIEQILAAPAALPHPAEPEGLALTLAGEP